MIKNMTKDPPASSPVDAIASCKKRQIRLRDLGDPKCPRSFSKDFVATLPLRPDHKLHLRTPRFCTKRLRPIWRLLKRC